MKLVMIDNSVVAGGEVAMRGSTHDTGIPDKNRKEDREAFTLIASKRALRAGTPEADQFLVTFAKEQEEIKKQRKAG